ncbi:MAG: DUF1565 domain-containing protein [Deinococcota bacterium]
MLVLSTTTLAQTQYYVHPDGSNDNDGLSPSQPFRRIQMAVDLAQAGDTIHLAPGHYKQDIQTVRSGVEGAPITIRGSTNAVVHGIASNRMVQVHHDYITLQGFTLDGLREGDDPERMGSYREKLLYAIAYDPQDGVNYLRVLNMTFRNAGEECVRLRYFAQHNEIAYSTFENCGVYDFKFGADGVVGEAIYLGTSSKQWDDGKNATVEPDQTSYNWIHHNVMNTQGNECVEGKEGTAHNIIEYNICTGQKDPNSGGIVSRGFANIIRFNEIYGNVGAGVRLGGHNVDDVQFDTNNHVYGNVMSNNEAGGIKFMVDNQGMVCANELSHPMSSNAVGTYADNYSPEQACPTELP